MEENAVPAPETADITDEQVEQFFESGGELPDETPKDETLEAEATEASQKEDEKEKFVPYGALHEERQRRKELQAEVERVRQENAQTSQVMQQVLQQIKQQQSPAPDPESDPVAYFQHQIAEQAQQIQQLTQYLNGNAQQAQQAQHETQLVNAYRSSAQEFTKQSPDFVEAYQHLVASRLSEYNALGYTNEQAQAMLNQDEMQLAAKAFQDGVSPAHRVYELAKLRGYQKQQASQEHKMQTIERGVKASSPTGGAPQGGDITLEALAAAADGSAEEFNELWSKFAKNAG
jgi:hypothetical protein